MSHTATDSDVRSTLLARRHELAARLERVRADQRREQEPLTADAPDRAIQRENDEVVDSISTHAHAELLQVDEALYRLDAGQYGFCDACGYPIEAKRLAAIPYATRCQACAGEPATKRVPAPTCCG